MSLALVTNDAMAFVSHILLFRYTEWKATEVHNVMQAFVIYHMYV